MNKKVIGKKIIALTLAAGMLLGNTSLVQNVQAASSESQISSSSSSSFSSSSDKPGQKSKDEYSVIVKGKPSIFNKSKVTAEYNDGYVLSYKTKESADKALKLYQTVSDAAGSGNDLFFIASDDKQKQTNESSPVSSSADKEKQKAKKPVIAVVDTGAPSNVNNIIDSTNVLQDQEETDTEDHQGHGTRVINDILNIYPDAQIISIKAMDRNGVGTSTSIYAGLEYAIEKKADIINLSVSAQVKGGNSALESLIHDATEQGITIVGAAGNNGDDAASYIPGGIQDVIVIGALENDGVRLPNSNYGKTVDYYIPADSTSDASAMYTAMYAKALADNAEITPGDVQKANANSVFVADQIQQPVKEERQDSQQSSSAVSTASDSNDEEFNIAFNIGGDAAGGYGGHSSYIAYYQFYESYPYATRDQDRSDVLILMEKNTSKGTSWTDQYRRVTKQTSSSGTVSAVNPSQASTAQAGVNLAALGTMQVAGLDTLNAKYGGANNVNAGFATWVLMHGYQWARATIKQDAEHPMYIIRLSDLVTDVPSMNPTPPTYRHIINVRYQDINGNWGAYQTVYDQQKKAGEHVYYGPWQQSSVYYGHNAIDYWTQNQDNTSYVDIPRKQYTYYFHDNKPANASHNVGNMQANITKYAENWSGNVKTPTLTGWTFIGWNTNQWGTGSWYSNEKMYSNKNFYAIWKANQYTVRYNKNGGQTSGQKANGNFADWGDEEGEYTNQTVNGSMPDSSYSYDTRGNLRKNTYTRKGYNWLGWRSASNGEGNDSNTIHVGNTRQDNAGVYNWTTKNGDLINLDAQWQKRLGKVTVTLVSEETNAPMANVTLQLKKNSGPNVGTVVETKATGADGKVTFENLHWFDYQIVSSSVPEGYKSVRTMSFRVDQNTCDTDQQLYRVVYMQEHTLKVNATVTDIINSGEDYRTKEEGLIYKKEKAPSFVYHVSGTDVAGIKHDYNMLANIDYDSKTGNDTQKVFAGKYTITEIPVSRYRQETAQTIKNATYDKGNKSAALRAVEDDAEITYPHSIREYGWLAAVSNAINRITSEHGAIIHYNVYNITYDYAGGTDSGNPSSYSEHGGKIVLNNPTREGYTFAGWTGSNGNTPQKEVTIENTTGDKHYTANWTVNTYKITYNYNGGTKVDNPVEYTTVSDDIILKNPTREGYRFDGWSEPEGGMSTNMVIPTGSAGDKSFTANWTPEEYSIDYDYNGGTDVGNPSGYNIESETITLMNPTRDDYTFTGWTGSNGTTPQMEVAISKGSTGNKSYTANWNDNSYTISYNYNGGKEVEGKENPTSYTVNSGTITLNNPIRDYYTFDGWTGSNGDTKDTNVAIPRGSSGNKSYTANWTPITYIISVDTGGGSVAVQNPATYNYESDTITLNNPTADGYDFVGWIGDTGVEFGVDGTQKPIQTVTIPHNSHGNKSFEAIWKPKEYNINYDYNGGDDANNPATYTHTDVDTDDEAPTITLKNPTRAHYTFDGWTWNGQTTPQLNVSFPTTDIGDKLFVANWHVNTYTVTRQYREQDVNGNYGEWKVAQSGTYPYGTTLQAIDIPGDDTYKALHFDAYTVGDSNATLTADRARKTYTITWNGNGNNADGSSTIITDTYFVGQQGTVVNHVPSNANKVGDLAYDFAGWYTSTIGGMCIDTATALPDHNVTYYAHWGHWIRLEGDINLDGGPNWKWNDGNHPNGVNGWQYLPWVEQGHYTMKWYYFRPSDNLMVTGWIQDGTNWYWCTTGPQHNSWSQVNPDYPRGSMLANTYFTYVPYKKDGTDANVGYNGKVFYFDASGRCTNP